LYSPHLPTQESLGHLSEIFDGSAFEES